MDTDADHTGEGPPAAVDEGPPADEDGGDLLVAAAGGRRGRSDRRSVRVECVRCGYGAGDDGDPTVARLFTDLIDDGGDPDPKVRVACPHCGRRTLKLRPAPAPAEDEA